MMFHAKSFLFFLLLAQDHPAVRSDSMECAVDGSCVSNSKNVSERSNADWVDLPDATREELKAEGWTQTSWDQDDDEDDDDLEYGEFDDEDFYTVEGKSWDELLPETRRHFESRGYTREAWDEEETNYQELKWSKLRDEKRQALSTLGWTEEEWDAYDRRPFRPVSEKTPWRELSVEEQEAATVLGHTAESWHVRAVSDFNPVVTSLPIPELQALNLDYFAELDVKVLVRDGLTLGDDENCEAKTMTMKEYIGDLRKGSKYYLKYEDEESFKKYIQAIIGPKVLHYMGEALRNSELRKNGSFSEVYDGLPLTDYNWAFWVGGANTTTSMHYDTDTMNFLWVAQGRKRVVILPNDERTAGKYECLSQFTEHSCWTGVDILSGPLPEHAVEVELGPGEGILFPIKCWHAVHKVVPTVAFGYRIDLAEFAK